MSSSIIGCRESLIRYKKLLSHVFWLDFWCKVKETHRYQYSPWWSSYWADAKTCCMQKLKRICARNLYSLCVYKISIFITSGTDVQHLVQEQSMEKECVDASSQRQSCPEIGRTFSEYTPTRHGCSSLSEAVLKWFTYRLMKLTMCQAWPWSQNSMYKVEYRATHILDKGKGRNRCHGGVSVLCWLVTPAVRPWSILSIRD
jgi:hypothetical protein